MSSRGRKKAALYEKLQLLRSVTNSSAVIPYPFKHLLSGLSFSSLICFYLCIDFPSAYENKTYTSFRVSLNGFKTSSFIPFIDILISEIHLLLASMHSKTSIIVDATKYIEDLKQKVDRLNQDVATSQFSADQNPLPVELGLNVLDARVSCSDSFHLEAVGGENEGQQDSIDAQVVKQAVLQAIKNWSESSEQE
ncbi:hypothetical protein CK203_030302 [Vitis vinifera]|uniref:Plant bHLH transcription factor ACT-like domain-containing protein n=1 Tax=Vitis vinifera TaxID=29760 RepID=A0A438IVF6_VITVI|nr:hypothetical protein CK203_030302 [Vitis vinifera]